MSNQGSSRAPSTAARESRPSPPSWASGGPGGPMGLLREGEKSKNTRGTLLRLWGYLQRQRWVLVGAALLVVVTTLVDLLGPYLMGLAIDRYIDQGRPARPGAPARADDRSPTSWPRRGTWLQTYLMAGRGAARGARPAQRPVRPPADPAAALLRPARARRPDEPPDQRCGKHQQHPGSQLQPAAFPACLGLVGVVIIMFVLNVPLAVVSLVVMPLTFVLTRVIAKRTRQGFRETQQTLGALNGIIEETITGAAHGQGLRARARPPSSSSPRSTAACRRSRCARASWPGLWAR